MRGGVHRTPFIGRQRELQLLLDHLDDAGRGEGGIVLVAGEPGIGKTRLLTELSSHAHARGTPVLWGSAYDAGGMPPYLMFHEALCDYIRGCPPDHLWAQIGRGGASLAQLVPELRDQLPDLPADPPLSPEQERYRLFESVAGFLTAAARSAGGGLLLILDDLHWADQSSLHLFRHLVRRVGGVPLLIAGAYRPEDLDNIHPLAEALADLSRLQVDARLSLPPLSAEETGDLIATLSGAPVSAAAVGAIQDEAEGNPFFIGEIVRHLQAEDRNLADSAPPAGWSVPESVRQVIGRRVTRLHHDTQRLLDAVAVLGDGASFELIAATIGGDE
jgi:predicted ATPase